MGSLFSFLEPLFRFLDGGKLFRLPFRILYFAIGVINALLFLLFIREAFSLNFTEYTGFMGTLYAIYLSLVCVLLAAFSFIYWWRRGGDIKHDIPDNARLQAIPAVGNLVITWAEWLGMVLGAGLLLSGLGAMFFLTFALESIMPVFIGLGIAVGGIIAAYILMLFFRLIGEQILVLALISNNTQKIARNTER